MDKKRLHFCKQISSPSMLKAIEQLAYSEKIGLANAAYRLMQNGAKEFIRNSGNPIAVSDIEGEQELTKASYLLTFGLNNELVIREIK